MCSKRHCFSFSSWKVKVLCLYFNNRKWDQGWWNLMREGAHPMFRPQVKRILTGFEHPKMWALVYMLWHKIWIPNFHRHWWSTLRIKNSRGNVLSKLIRHSKIFTPLRNLTVEVGRNATFECFVTGIKKFRVSTHYSSQFLNKIFWKNQGYGWGSLAQKRRKE